MANRQLRVYADTSIYGGVFNPIYSPLEVIQHDEP